MDTVEFLICMELVRSGYSVEGESHTWCLKREFHFYFSFAHNQCLVWLNKYKTSMDHHRQKSYALLIWQFKVIGSYLHRLIQHGSFYMNSRSIFCFNSWELYLFCTEPSGSDNSHCTQLWLHLKASLEPTCKGLHPEHLILIFKVF